MDLCLYCVFTVFFEFFDFFGSIAISNSGDPDFEIEIPTTPKKTKKSKNTVKTQCFQPPIPKIVKKHSQNHAFSALQSGTHAFAKHVHVEESRNRFRGTLTRKRICKFISQNAPEFSPSDLKEVFKF